MQAQAARDSPTKVEDPENPESPGSTSRDPAIKRQHLIVMRHGERIDEVSITTQYIADTGRAVNGHQGSCSPAANCVHRHCIEQMSAQDASQVVKPTICACSVTLNSHTLQQTYCASQQQEDMSGKGLNREDLLCIPLATLACNVICCHCEYHHHCRSHYLLA